MTDIRILTVRQPWAWAIFHGKDVENRSRNVAGSWRGTIAIHAAKAIADGDQTLTSPLVDVLNPLLNAIPPVPRSWWANRGAIIGVVDLVGVHHCFNASTDFEGCSPWAEPDTWHLELANPRPLSEPFPFRGALGLRRLPEDVARQVFQRIGRTA